jgi:hypothetical protein
VDSLECVLLALADTEYFAVRKSVRLAVAGKSHCQPPLFTLARSNGQPRLIERHSGPRRDRDLANHPRSGNSF